MISLKLIACMMLIVVGAAAGVSAAITMTERVRLLKTINRFIKSLGEKTLYNPRDLGEMITDLKESVHFSDCELISAIDTSLVVDKGFDTAWEKALQLNGNMLKAGDRELLAEFGASMGKSDREVQHKHCVYYCDRLEDMISIADDDARRKGRLYISLGTMAGVFAVIMLI